MARILVTGGTGFIGSHLANRLVQDGHDVIITGVQTENIPCTKMLEPGLSGIDWKQLGNIDVLFHQAANNDTTCKDRDAMMLANYHDSVQLFTRCFDQCGCRKFIFASSTAVYGAEQAPYKEGVTPIKPMNVYGESKAKFEEWALDFASRLNIWLVGLRYCNVYGTGEKHKKKRASMIRQMTDQILQSNSVTLFKWGQQRRDFIYVKDVVDANIQAMNIMNDRYIKEILNCGSGQSETFANIASLIHKAAGIDSLLETKWIENPYESAYQNHTECNMALTKAVLDFVPKYSIADGIKDFIAQHS